MPQIAAGTPHSGLGVASLKSLRESRCQALALILFVERKQVCLSNPVVKSVSFYP